MQIQELERYFHYMNRKRIQIILVEIKFQIILVILIIFGSLCIPQWNGVYSATQIWHVLSEREIKHIFCSTIRIR